MTSTRRMDYRILGWGVGMIVAGLTGVAMGKASVSIIFVLLVCFFMGQLFSVIGGMSHRSQGWNDK